MNPQYEKWPRGFNSLDEYLEFIEKPKQYDLIGSVSERFLEARRIITATENHQKDFRFVAKLKAILFLPDYFETDGYWQLRFGLRCSWGDPTKRGPKAGGK